MPKTMKALALNDEGTGMKTVEIARPTPAAQELLVKVKYSAIDTTLASIATKDISSGYIHDMKSKPLVTGYHFSGTIVEVGEEVKSSSFNIGDAVFGHLQFEPTQKQGSFSEYIAAPETDIALIPSKVTMEVAAASATEVMTALQAMRDKGALKEGQSILIIGAGGGVGSAAVGIAKALGANVTAVCSTKDVARVEQWGAHKVIDRSRQDPKRLAEKFNVVFDVPSKYSFIQGMKWLEDGGFFVNTLPTIEKLAFGWFWPLITRKHLETVQVESRKEDLELVGNWLVEGQVPVDIDSIHKVSDFATAWERQKNSQRTGRVVIQVQEGW